MRAVASQCSSSGHLDQWMLLEEKRPDISTSFSRIMQHQEILHANIFQSPAQSSNILSSGQEIGSVICRRSKSASLQPPSGSRRRGHRSSMVCSPTKIPKNDHSIHGTLSRLSLLTLPSASDSGARHPSSFLQPLGFKVWPAPLSIHDCSSKVNILSLSLLSAHPTPIPIPLPRR